MNHYFSIEEFNEDLEISILDTEKVANERISANPSLNLNTETIRINTDRGSIEVLLNRADNSTQAVLLFGGARGGPYAVLGPGDNVYQVIAERLSNIGITVLRLHYREAGNFTESVLDVMGACLYLTGIGINRIVVVGHSFGGAVAIKIGQLLPSVIAVAALATQLYGTRQVSEMYKPLLLIHGTQDEILYHTVSEDIFARANNPKKLVLINGAGHRLEEDAQRLFDELNDFLVACIDGALSTFPEDRSKP